jgi:cobalt-zinc-cadmium efflux system membrane fusion protein
MRTMNLQAKRDGAISAHRMTRLAIALLGLASMSLAFAHGGQIEVGGGAKGPVHLTAVQQKMLGLKLEAATLRPLSELLNLNGEVRPLPGRQAEVSTRISGQVREIYTALGNRVSVGQRLARVQSRLVGDPPPSVDVSAPMSGIVDVMSVAVGQSVEPTTVMFHIQNSTAVNVVAKVYEEDLGKIKLGQDANAKLLSYPDRMFSGKVGLIGPSLDPLSRTVEVWVTLPNTEGLLKPNLFARVGVVLKQNAATLAVPNAAIIEANGEKFVFVRQKGAYARVEVTTGSSDDKYTEITEGLVPGDEVVTQGNRQVYTVWLTGGTPTKGEE